MSGVCEWTYVIKIPKKVVKQEKSENDNKMWSRQKKEQHHTTKGYRGKPIDYKIHRVKDRYEEEVISYKHHLN